MHVLRAEKGYIIVGQDTDGTVTPDDAGLAWAIGKSKAGFRRQALPRAPRHERPAAPPACRASLPQDPQTVLEEGAQVMAAAGSPVPTRPLGHVTSSYYSAALGRSIAMGLIGGRPRAARTDPVRAHEPPGRSRSRSSRRCSMTPPERASMADLSTGTAGPSADRRHSGCARCRVPAAGYCAGDEAVRLAAAEALGVTLPAAACRAGVSGERAALWLGPDEWLLLAPLAQSGLAQRIERALAGLPHSLVDVSHRQVALLLEGPAAAALLASGCALGLDAAAFPISMCTRTMLAKAEVRAVAHRRGQLPP